MKQLVGYFTGTLSGMIISQGWNVFTSRDGLPGGEILIIPLIILLVVFGWYLGKDQGHRKHSYRANKGELAKDQKGTTYIRSQIG